VDHVAVPVNSVQGRRFGQRDVQPAGRIDRIVAALDDNPDFELTLLRVVWLGVCIRLSVWLRVDLSIVVPDGLS
jgi:hypothetical protein